MKKRKKKEIKHSVPTMFTRKYIYYYYAFFWILLVGYLILK